MSSNVGLSIGRTIFAKRWCIVFTQNRQVYVAVTLLREIVLALIVQ